MIELNTNLKDYEPIEVSKSTITDIYEKYSVNEKNEIYFIAYETEPTKPISVLLPDMEYLRNNFGVVKHNSKSIITHASLNYIRLINIENMKEDIKDRDSKYWNGTDFGMVDNYYYGKPNPNNPNMIDWNKQVPRVPTNRSKNYRFIVEKDIEKGLYIICKYV